MMILAKSSPLFALFMAFISFAGLAAIFLTCFSCWLRRLLSKKRTSTDEEENGKKKKKRQNPDMTVSFLQTNRINPSLS